MSYDIFFIRRDPGQSFEDALDEVEDSYEGGDPGPLTDLDLEQWDALLPLAREILGGGAELTRDDENARELTDPATGIELMLITGEIEIHVPSGGDDPARTAALETAYELAGAVEEVTGLEGYDPQRGEAISGTGESAPSRRRSDSDEDDDDDEPDDFGPRHSDTGNRHESTDARRRWALRRP